MNNQFNPYADGFAKDVEVVHPGGYGGAIQASRLAAPTLKERMEARRDQCRAQLAEIEKTLELLDRHPEVVQLFEQVAKVGF